MSVRTTRFLIAAAFVLGMPTLLQAQWITFTEMTGTYTSGLSTSTTTGDPNEKDFGLGDLDKDGDIDIVNARKEAFYATGSRSHILLMNVSGVLTDQTATYAPGFNTNPSLARAVVIADFDGDTWLDVVIANTDFQPTHYYRNLGASGGTWLGLNFETGRIPTFTPGPRFCSAGGGDADGDGDIDLFLGDYNNNLEDRILINNGAGVFTDETATWFPGGGNAGIFSVESNFADADLDGDLDIFESVGQDGLMKVHVKGVGLSYTTQIVSQFGATYTNAIGDLNNDGKIDIFEGRDGQDVYKLNTSPVGGPISFSSTTLTGALNPKTAGFAGNAYVVDMDMDGDKDLVMGDTDVDVPGCPFSPQASALILRNGTIGPAQTQVLVDPWGNPNTYVNIHKPGTHDIAVLDLNSDGLPDMFYGRCTGYHVFIQDGQPFSLSVTEPAPGALVYSLNNGAPNMTTYTLISLVQLTPAGSGPFFGLDSSALQNFIGLYPLGDPFAYTTDVNGDHTWSIPGGMPSPLPTQWRAIQLTGPTGSTMTNVVTITF
jgi:hypothetical protein